jgi:hypothetical protein
MTEEEESNSVTVRVSSSEEFVQSKRLRQILDSKERVLDEYYESTRNHNIRGMNANRISEFERNRRIAHAVVEFCIEVEPVLDQAEEKEVFEQNTIELDRTTHSIADIVDTGGRIGDMVIEPEQSMFIYRIVSKKLANIGIGINLEEDKEPAEI